MQKLRVMLQEKSQRKQFIEDCVAVIQTEINSKKGLSGLAIKQAYNIACKARSDILHTALDHLMDDFLKNIETLYHHTKASDFLTFANTQTEDLAQALLKTTDNRINHAQSTIQALYRSFRKEAHKHVIKATPRIAAVIHKYLTA